MEESMLKVLKMLAAKSQELKGQEAVYDTMFHEIFPQVIDMEGNFLEIGVFLGKTTIFLSRYLEMIKSSKKLISIDPLDEEFNNCRNSQHLNIRHHFG